MYTKLITPVRDIILSRKEYTKAYIPSILYQSDVGHYYLRFTDGDVILGPKKEDFCGAWLTMEDLQVAELLPGGGWRFNVMIQKCKHEVLCIAERGICLAIRV